MLKCGDISKSRKRGKEEGGRHAVVERDAGEAREAMTKEVVVVKVSRL